MAVLKQIMHKKNSDGSYDTIYLRTRVDNVLMTDNSTLLSTKLSAMDTSISGKMNTSGGTFTGNVSGKYFIGTWLQTTSSSNLGSAASKICVLDSAGWIYFRTAAEILSDIGAAASSHSHSGYASSSHNHDSAYAAKSHTHSYAASNHTHNYAGSSSVGGAANSVKTNLAIKLNSGTTEGTNLFTFNGSTAKTIDITPATIGAAASSHTHSYAASNHNHDGVYAAASHTHSYAASSHTHAASQITTGTFNSTATYAKTGTDYTTARIRNIKASTTDLTAGSSKLNSGDIYLVYE